MSEHICRNCRWWEGPECDDWACCGMAESEGDEPINPQAKMIGTSSAGIDAGLIVRYDFGCVQWEGKEEVPVQDYARPST